MICKTKTTMNQRTVSRRARRAFRTTLPGVVLALLAHGCGERLELGEIAQEFDEPGSQTGDLISSLLVDGVEDADAVLEDGAGFRMGGSVGDVDGDGYADWMHHAHLAYGRPRPADGVLTVPPDEGPTFAWHDGVELVDTQQTQAGDVNGDGYDDVLFQTWVGSYHRYEFEQGENAAAVAEEEAAVARRWATQRAFLWYGGPDRSPGNRELSEVAIGFGDRDDLVGRLQTELTEKLGEDDAAYAALQAVALTALGDIDSDGYGDLALTSTFDWHAHRDEQRDDGILQVTTRQRSESVSYIFYGQSERFAAGAAPEAAARFEGVSSLRAIGDVNGDGYGDLIATTANGARLISGGAQRLSGEPSLDAVGVPLAGMPIIGAGGVGDIDQDGFDDLVILWGADDQYVAQNYLFYGSSSFLDGPLTLGAADAVFAIPGTTAIVSNIGDWNGDGASDLLLMHGRMVTTDFEAEAGLEVRLIAGSASRYSGQYDFSVLRPDAEWNDSVMAASEAGDLDADGKMDLFFAGRKNSTERATYVKYGGPLVTTPPIY